MDPDSLRHKLSTEIPWDIYFSDIIKVEASPGYPWLLLGKTNKTVIRDYKQVLIDVTIDRLIKLLTWDINSILMMTPQQLMDYNLVDPVRLFVKNEPHASSKFKTGKMRLISSVSIVDQLIERLLHSRINEYLIMDWKAIPSKPGIGLNTDADFSAITDQFKQILHPCSSDIKGWDWSVQYDELIYVAELRSHMYGLPTEHPFMRAICIRQHLVATSIYGLSDGTLFYSPTEIGIQLSGCYLTSAGNSEIRIANTINAAAINMIACSLDEEDVHTAIVKATNMYNLNPQRYLDSLPHCYNMAMGDDCIEDYNDPDNKNLLGDIYAHLGHPVKFVTKMEDNSDSMRNFEFCSHLVTITNTRDYVTHWPINVGKTMYTLSHQPASRRTVETLDQFLTSMRHHPLFDEVCAHLLKDPLWSEVTQTYLGTLIPTLEYTQSCLSEMTKAGQKRVVMNKINRKGDQVITIKQKRTPTVLTEQIDREVVEYVHPIGKHLNLGPKKITKHQFIREPGSSGINPISRSVEYSRESFKVSGIKDGVRVRGSSIISQLLAPWSNLAQITSSIMMHPKAMNSIQMDNLAPLYTKYKFNKFTVEVVPQLPTTSTGMIFGAIYPSVDTFPPIQSLTLKKYMQANPTFKEKNIYNTLRLSMPQSKYLPAYTMEYNVSDTSMQGVAYLGAQFGTEAAYIGDVIVHYEVDLFNMTAPAYVNPSANWFTYTFKSTQNLTDFAVNDTESYGHPHGIYMAVCTMSSPIRGSPTRNGPNLSESVQVLWYMFRSIPGSYTHSWHYTYENAVNKIAIQLTNVPQVTTSTTVKMYLNLVRKFGTDAEQPYDHPSPKIEDITDEEMTETTGPLLLEEKLESIRRELEKLKLRQE